MTIELNEHGSLFVARRQIYIVDDDLSVCRALKLLLQSYAFAVTTFDCAQDFFQEVSNDEPGCLILDIHMPGLDGWATMQRLFASGSTRSVIVISAEKNGGLKERALKAGAKGFLQKPVNGTELVDLIDGEFIQ